MPSSGRQPLSEPVFRILLSLAEEPRHGYGIILRVQESTEGGVRLRTGTLYTALARMEGYGWVFVHEEDADGRRGKVYKLTQEGQRIVVEETARLSGLVDLALRVQEGTP